MSYPLPVFVSSSCYELRDLRSAIRAWLTNLGLTPMMSDEGGFPHVDGMPPYATCLRVVEECPLVVGVIDRQYGRAFDDWGPYPQHTGCAPTHAELRHALDLGKRVLIYVHDDTWNFYEVWRKHPDVFKASALSGLEEATLRMFTELKIQFTTPAGLPAGTYNLFVSAVGVQSKDAFRFTTGVGGSGDAGAAANADAGTAGGGGGKADVGASASSGSAGGGGSASGGGSSSGGAPTAGSGSTANAGGSNGAGGSLDGGAGTGGQPSSPSGCGCSTPGGPSGREGAAALLGVVGLLAATGRRARRARRCWHRAGFRAFRRQRSRPVGRPPTVRAALIREIATSKSTLGRRADPRRAAQARHPR
jgi:MYXO-CTERM domain-containing protein